MTSRESYFANIGRVQDCLLNSNFKFSELRNAGQLGYMISNETYDHKRLVIDFSLTGAALNVMGSNDFGKTLAWFNYDQELMEQITSEISKFRNAFKCDAADSNIVVPLINIPDEDNYGIKFFR